MKDLPHPALGSSLFFKGKFIEVLGLLVTFENVRDESREIRDNLSWEEFLERRSVAFLGFLDLSTGGRFCQGLKAQPGFLYMRPVSLSDFTGLSWGDR